MLFVECGEYLKANQMTLPELLKKAWDVGVAWQDGRKFVWKDAMRLNLALPRTRLEEAMRRLSEYVF